MCCAICKIEDDRKLYNTFGKLKCKPCIEKTKTGRKGHSGMIYHPDTDPEDYRINESHLQLIRTKKSDNLFVKWFIEHYPNSKGIVGRQVNFHIYKDCLPIGIIGFASPPLNYRKFHEYFGFDDEMKYSESAKLFLNNNVFRIVHSEKNIGTQVLKIARRKLPVIYKEQYGTTLQGLVTFVEKPRTGAMYKADNWDVIGETEGIEVKRRGEDWLTKQYIKTDNKKLIFGYKFRR